MWRCPPASGTPFITRPRAKKKPRGPTEESRPKQNLLVYPRTPPHRQVDAILPATASTLERASELIDAKQAATPRQSLENHRPVNRLYPPRRDVNGYQRYCVG